MSQPKSNSVSRAQAGHNKMELKRQLQAAWNMYRQGLLADAESFCHGVLEQSANEPDALHLAGTLALQHGKAKEAAQLFQRAIAGNSKNAEYFANLGLAYHEQGAIAQAVEAYQQAIKRRADYADAYYNLHAALISQADLSPAINALKKVLKINPQDSEARFMLGLLLDCQGNPESGLEYFAALPKRSVLYQARLDAWDYLKSRDMSIPVMGSAVHVFEFAMQQAIADGLILEFGVRFGNSITMLAGLTSQVLHGFDSFEGLPDEWHHEPKGSYTTKGAIPDVPANVELHTGWFEDSLPVFLKEHTEPVRFLNIDCDMYSSTNTVLSLLAPRVTVGTVIVFDEYIGNEHWRDDEFKAFQEAVAKNGWQYVYLCFSFFTKQVAVKITKIKLKV